MEQKILQRLAKKEDARPNLTGIPTQMKLDFEQRSGLSFDDVRVHYNSDKPAQLQALAYTQGTQVYVGPGQERYLSHELGHVLQQKRGLVRPTMWMGNVPINDDPRLEKAADLAADGGADSFASSSVSSVIQRAEALSVGVSLRLRDDIWTHEPCEYIVDKIMLSGRSTTGLPKGSQGDHTIADVFIKKHQSTVVKGLPLDQAVQFYTALFHEVSYHNDLLPKVTEQEEKEINVYARRKESRRLTQEGLTRCDALLGATLNAKDMRRRFKEIIVFFNNAYAHSPFSTMDVDSENRTGGRNEQSGMGELRQSLIGKLIADPDFLEETLTDPQAIHNIQEGVDSLYEDPFSVEDVLKSKFFGMLYEMGKNKYEHNELLPKQLFDTLGDSVEGSNILDERYRQIGSLNFEEWKAHDILAEEIEQEIPLGDAVDKLCATMRNIYLEHVVPCETPEEIFIHEQTMREEMKILYNNGLTYYQEIKGKKNKEQDKKKDESKIEWIKNLLVHIAYFCKSDLPLEERLNVLQQNLIQLEINIDEKVPAANVIMNIDLL